MKLKKGSIEAKRYMAKIRAKKKPVKKTTLSGSSLFDKLKRSTNTAKKNVAYSVIDKTLISANPKEKTQLKKAKKIIQNTNLGYSKDRLKIVKETTKEFNKLIKKNPTAKKNRAKSLSIAQLNASIKLRKKYPYVDPYSKKGNLGSINKNQPKIDRNKSNIDYINYCLDRIRVYNNNIEFHKENIKNTKDPYIKKRAKFEIKDTQMMIKELKQAITKTKKHIK